MAAASDKVRILVIRPWTESLALLRAALRDHDIDAKITRVDIEPALNAALQRTQFDVVVFDPNTPDVTRDIVEARLREHGQRAPVVVLDTVESAIVEIKHALAARLN